MNKWLELKSQATWFTFLAIIYIYCWFIRFWPLLDFLRFYAVLANRGQSRILVTRYFINRLRVMSVIYLTQFFFFFFLNYILLYQAFDFLFFFVFLNYSVVISRCLFLLFFLFYFLFFFIFLSQLFLLSLIRALITLTTFVWQSANRAPHHPGSAEPATLLRPPLHRWHVLGSMIFIWSFYIYLIDALFYALLMKTATVHCHW